MLEVPGARYEFRAFALHFGSAEERLRQLGEGETLRESDEIYLVSAGNLDHNTKIRAGLMDIKVLVNRERGLEQWDARWKGAFPLSAEAIREHLFPALGVPLPELTQTAYHLDEFLDRVIRPQPDLLAVPVGKRRFGFRFQGCVAELAAVRVVKDQRIHTMAVEALDPDAVLAARTLLGLDGYENVSYPLAIQRIIGMEPG